MFLRVVSSDPDRDRDVVGCPTIGNGESAMKTEQQLGSPIVIGCAEESESGERDGERWTGL